MKRIQAKILSIAIVITCLSLPAISQDDRSMRIGFQASPLISWVSNNDNRIVVTEGNIGFKLGTTADIYFKDNYSFTLGINLAFHEGGEFQYDLPGSYLPKSDLTEPDLQTGTGPMEAGSKIKYNLQYVEFPIGLKIRSKEIGYIRYFVEAPIFTFSFLTRGRGDIETSSLKLERENIYKDLQIFNIFWGLGAGLEYSISENNSLIGGLYFQNGLIDFTRDQGHIEVEPLITEPEDSRATVNNLILRLGILF